MGTTKGTLTDTAMILATYLKQSRNVKIAEHRSYQALLRNVQSAINLRSWISIQAKKPSVLVGTLAAGAAYGLAGGKMRFAKLYATRRLMVLARRKVRQFYLPV